MIYYDEGLAVCKYNISKKTEHFTLRVKDNDTTKTVNIQIVVWQTWHILTRTRTIAMFYLKCIIVRTCDFFHYLMTINLETVQRISFTKVTSYQVSYQVRPHLKVS